MNNGRWYANLVLVVCEYNMCRSLIVSLPHNGRLKQSNFQIIGRKKNVEVVLYLISCLSHQFVTIGKRQYAQYKHDCIWIYGINPKSMTIYLKSFLYGCVIGLYRKLKESKNNLSYETNITALVQTTSAEIDDFLKGEKIRAPRNSKTQIDTSFAKQGVNVGKNIEIFKGIHDNTVREDVV